MLRQAKSKTTPASGGYFAIVASRYNARYVDAMVRAAMAGLKRAGVKHIEVVGGAGACGRAAGTKQIQRVAVRGVWETPAVAPTLASEQMPRPSAVICLGVI